MKRLSFPILFFGLLAACASSPTPKQKMLNDIYEHDRSLKKIEKQIDLGLPKTEKEFFDKLREDLKAKNTLKI